MQGKDVDRRNPDSGERSEIGVGDGVRTRDIRCHRPTLYQLSYSHHSSDVLDSLRYFCEREKRRESRLENALQNLGRASRWSKTSITLTLQSIEKVRGCDESRRLGHGDCIQQALTLRVRYAKRSPGPRASFLKIRFPWHSGAARRKTLQSQEISGWFASSVERPGSQRLRGDGREC
jgi:hypothetical protein